MSPGTAVTVSGEKVNAPLASPTRTTCCFTLPLGVGGLLDAVVD